MYMLNFKYFVVLVFFSFSFCNAFNDDESENNIRISSRTHRTKSIDRQPSWNYFSIAKKILITGGSLGLAGYFLYKKQPTPAKIFASLGGLSLLHDLISTFSLSPAKSAQNQRTITDGTRQHFLSSSPSFSEEDSQIVPFGHMQLVVPGDVEITDDGHGNKLIKLPNVCCLIVFDEYRQAIVKNKIVKALHDSKRNQISQCTDLDKKLRTSYNDMRTTAQQIGGNAEAFINTMEGFVQEITKGTDGTTIPDDITIRWERHKTTFEGRILFVKDSRALLVRIDPLTSVQ